MNIFREQQIEQNVFTSNEDYYNSTTSYIHRTYRTHDNGIPRARTYNLDDIMYFSIFKGYTIKEVIETNFDYFLWFPRNITGFKYSQSVINYADDCLAFLQKIFNGEYLKSKRLSYAMKQVILMQKYEHYLDYDYDKNLRDAYKGMVDVKFYETIYNTQIEKLLRQKISLNLSPEIRMNYFNEVKRLSSQVE